MMLHQSLSYPPLTCILSILIHIFITAMGGCQSSDYVEIPQQPSSMLSILENKFKSIEKRVFPLPADLNTKLEPISSNGKITDFITKNSTPVILAYEQTNIQSSLDGDHKFVDKSFPTSQQSLGPESYPQNIEWKRASEFMKGDFGVFEGKIQPTDIKQGRLGDCYLLSSMAAISEFPFIVKRLFETTEVSSYGYYGVWLFVDGLWRCVVLDDFFPLHGGRPFFSRTQEQELWVMLIEKAYAKSFGNYQKIEQGLTGIGLNTLTGAPFEYLNKDQKSNIDVDVAWNFVTSNFELNHLIIGSSENNDRNGYLGLVSEHAYTILDAQEVHIATKKGKKKERILQLGNPWGKYEWKGRWSDYSDVWSEELRQQLHFEKADDGIFWINIEDFVENFGQICACKYNKNYISTSIQLKFSKDLDSQFKGIFLRTTQRTQGYLSLIQRDHRNFSKAYEYSLCRLIVLKLDKASGNLGGYVNDVIDCDRDGTVRVELDPGDYYLLVQMDWKCNFSRQVVLNYYGQHPVNMVEDTSPLDIPNLFNEIVLLHQKFTEKERVYQYAKDSKVKRTTGTIAGYVYYHYTNQSADNNYLCETVALKERKYIDVLGEQQLDQFTVKVYAGEERIVRLKVKKEGNSFYSFSTKIQFYIVEKYSLERLRELTDKKPTKMKKREIQGKEIDVRVKTYNYSGGIVLLYQNKMDKYAYIEEITFELDNLQLQNQTLTASKKLQIELQPNQQKMLSFVVCSPGKEIVFRTKMSFYLNAPEFKF